MIRHAQIQDIERLAILTTELGYPTTTAKMELRYKKFLSHDGYGIFVALVSDEVIAYIAWSRCVSVVYDRFRFHIEAVIVDEKYRGNGIGKELILSLENYVKQFAPTIIDLTTNMMRIGTPEFYKALGYVNEGQTAKFYFRKQI